MGRTTTIDLRGGIAALSMAALLGLGACGGDDDGGTKVGAGDPGGPAAGGANDAAEASGVAAEACGLLEVAEVEQQFGRFGAVHDGEPTQVGCSWQVGDQVEGAAVAPVLNLQLISEVTPPDEAMAEVRTHADAVDVQGVGDDAIYDFGVLYVREGDEVVALQAYTIMGVDLGSDGLRDQLVTLAEQALARLL
jgi:hypothetical protein